MVSPRPRVAVTGMGVVSPCGHGLQGLWDAVRAGHSSARAIEGLDVTGLDSRIGCQVLEFDPLVHIEPKRARHMDRGTQLAVAAARLAWEDAGISGVDPLRCGILVGAPATTSEWVFRQYDIFNERGIDRVNPFTVTAAFTGASAGELAINLGLRGPCLTVCTGSASGTDAVGSALRVIQAGEADVMVTGGSEAPFSLPLVALFNRIGVLSKRNDDPQTACRPFDVSRDGFVMGEGSGFLVLESEEHALRRGARVRGYVAGYGRTCDAYHMNAPDPGGQGAAAAMRLAIGDAGLVAEDVDYVNAHGTATQLNDPVEAKAVRDALGVWGEEVYVSSTKPVTGHSQGAAGALEAIITLLAIEHRTIPPNANLTRPDPECRLNLVTPAAVETEVAVAMSNSYGFGGRNCSLILTRGPC